MGLKGYRLWVMGQLDSNLQSPTAALLPQPQDRRALRVLLRRVVAVHVEFERQILKPVFHLIGFRLWV
jgi:hypothetical protein